MTSLDMDAKQVPVLLDAEFRGRPRKLVLFANRNGFYYVLDRLTGEFLSGQGICATELGQRTG